MNETNLKYGTDEYYRSFIPDWDDRHVRHVNFGDNPFSSLATPIHYEALEQSRNNYNKMLREDVDIFKNVETKNWMVYCRHQYCKVKLAELTQQKPKLSIAELVNIYCQQLHKPH